MYQHLTLSTLALIGEPGPVPPELFGLADESLADISAAIHPAPAAYAGTGFWPVVPTEPTYDPATQRLGTLVLSAPDPKTRTVPATYAVEALPPPPLPENVTNSDWRVGLILWGRFDEVEAKVVAARDSGTIQGKIVWQRWEYANDVYRAELMEQRAGFGFSEGDVDESMVRGAAVGAASGAAA